MQLQSKINEPFLKGHPNVVTDRWTFVIFQLCWLYRAATLLSKCDGHSVLGEVDVIPTDKDTNRLYSSCAIRRHVEQRSKWPECSKLTANGEKKVNVTRRSILS